MSNLRPDLAFALADLSAAYGDRQSDRRARFTRIAASLDAVCESLDAARSELEVLRVMVTTDDAREAIDEMLERIKKMSDDPRSAHASGIVCDVYEPEKEAAE